MGKREELIEAAQDALDANWRENHRMMATRAVDAVIAKLKEVDGQMIAAAANEAAKTGAGDFVAILRAVVSTLEPKP